MNDSFAADIAVKARWAHDHNADYPKPAWSTGEKLAVALVLRNHAYLRSAGYTEQEARQRLSGDIMGADVDAWLASVRDALGPGRDPTGDVTASATAEILAALPLRPRPGLYIDSAQWKESALLILEEPADPEDRGSDAIIGLAVPGVLGGWYLGCITCQAEISEQDAGMCQPCRRDEEWHDRQRRMAEEEPESNW